MVRPSLQIHDAVGHLQGFDGDRLLSKSITQVTNNAANSSLGTIRQLRRPSQPRWVKITISNTIYYSNTIILYTVILLNTIYYNILSTRVKKRKIKFMRKLYCKQLFIQDKPVHWVSSHLLRTGELIS